MNSTATSPPAQAASVVLAATRPMPSQSIADSVEPGLKPYQPNQRMTAPMEPIVRLELPTETWAEHDRAAQGEHTTDHVDDGRAGEVAEHRVARKTVEPAHRVAEPAARTPDPVAEDRVDEAGHADAVEDVALEAGAA